MKPIFTVLFHRHSPAVFNRRWEKRSRATIPPTGLEEASERLYYGLNPKVHRYNDIAGFAEIYWDLGTRILANYYFRGDRRTKYGRQIGNQLGVPVSGKHYYLLYNMVEEASFVSASVSEKRNALLAALQRVKETGKRLGCFVDLRTEISIAKCLNVEKYMSRGRSAPRRRV